MFLVNSCQGYFRCVPNLAAWESLIPKLRLLFCRVPWRPLTRSPCSTRADHLCRFAVRFPCIYAEKFFSEACFVSSPAVARRVFASLEIRTKADFPDLPRKLSHDTNINPIICETYCTSSLHRNIRESGNINPVSITFGFRHRLRPD